MPQTATVQVQAVGVEPVARFVALVCQAEKYAGRMTEAELSSLPGPACDAIATLQEAVRLLADNKLIEES